MAIAGVLRNPVVTSAVFGASRPEQIKEIVAVQQNLEFSVEELAAINAILSA